MKKYNNLHLDVYIKHHKSIILRVPQNIPSL